MKLTADRDADPEKGDIVFDDAGQQEAWFKFVHSLNVTEQRYARRAP
jgi:hypothetical protein